MWHDSILASGPANTPKHSTSIRPSVLPFTPSPHKSQHLGPPLPSPPAAHLVSLSPQHLNLRPHPRVLRVQRLALLARRSHRALRQWQQTVVGAGERVTS